MNIYNYTTFKEEFAKEFVRYVPEPYKSGERKIEKIGKNNGMRDALCFVPNTGIPSPIIYLDEAYDFYCEESDLEATCRNCSKQFLDGLAYLDNMMNDVELDCKPENIVFELVNAEKNQELLEKVPHRLFLDFALIYRFVITPGNEYNLHSAIITNQYMEDEGYNEEILYEIAMVNTPKIFPAKITMICDSFIALTNEQGVFGATTMLYEGILDKIGKILDNDFVIIPSSIHEVFLVSDEDIDLDDLIETINHANNTVCSAEEYLSDKPYKYIRSEEMITEFQ